MLRVIREFLKIPETTFTNQEILDVCGVLNVNAHEVGAWFENELSEAQDWERLDDNASCNILKKISKYFQVPVTPTPTQALYANISILEHSCINNASKHFDGDNRLAIIL